MAENVAVTTLEIKGTEKVATTMKELKAQIQGYRDELVALGQVEDKNEAQMQEQVRVTEKLQKAAKMCDIELVDHLIVAADGYFSFADEGLL